MSSGAWLERMILASRHRSSELSPTLSNTILLMHGEGADGSTTFTDSSSLAQTMNGQGNAQIDTAQFKFGSASMLFDGTGDYIKAATPGNFTIFDGAFTIASWVRPAIAAGSVQRNIYTATENLVSGFYWLGLVCTGTGKAGLNVQLGSGTSLAGTTTLPVGDWSLVAASCDGAGNAYLSVNGIVEATNASFPTLADAKVQHVAVGGMANGYTDATINHFNGWIDEMLVCNACLFTGDFEMPTAAWSPS